MAEKTVGALREFLAGIEVEMMEVDVRIAELREKVALDVLRRERLVLAKLGARNQLLRQTGKESEVWGDGLEHQTRVSGTDLGQYNGP